MARVLGLAISHAVLPEDPEQQKCIDRPVDFFKSGTGYSALTRIKLNGGILLERPSGGTDCSSVGFIFYTLNLRTTTLP